MKSVFGFRVRLGNPDLDFENLNPDFPIARTLGISRKGSTPLFGLDRYVPLSRKWFPGSWATILEKNVIVCRDVSCLHYFVVPTIFYQNITMDEPRMDNFIQITVFCPSEPQVAAFVYRNAGKVD